MAFRIAVLDDYQAVALKAADWSPLAGHAEITAFHDHLADIDALAKRLESFDAVMLMRERTRIPAALMTRLPRLKLIITGAPPNRITDEEAAAANGVAIVHAKLQGGSTEATAAMTWALILSLIRDVPAQSRSVRDGGWQTSVGLDLAGRTLGLVGLGKVGSEVARIAAAFGMEVIAWSQNLTDEAAVAAGAKRVDKQTLLANADIVSLHLVLSERSRHIIDAAALAGMKPGAFLINTSRGGLIDEAALIEALDQGRLAGAGLDVFETEPLPLGHPFRHRSDVLATPHLGFVTDGGLRANYQAMINLTAEYLAR